MGIDFNNVNINTTDIFIFAGIILAAIGAIWGIKKMILLGYFSSGDDSEDEYIGSVGDKFWYYDNDGEVYSETDEEEDLNIGWEK